MFQQNGSIDDFISRNNIVLNVTKVDNNPNYICHSKEDEQWQKETNHYKCKIKRNRTSFTMYLSRHKSNTQLPTAREVLDSQAVEASCIDSSVNFEDWAEQLGYNTDSRKAEKTYKICLMLSARFQDFLGEKLYNELLNEIERL